MIAGERRRPPGSSRPRLVDGAPARERLLDRPDRGIGSGTVTPLRQSRESAALSNGALDGLRVLFAVDSRFPAVGGAETQALKIATRLRERGALVRFVTPRVLPEQALRQTHEGFQIERIDYPHLRWFGSLALMVNFARYLMRERDRTDVLHVHITHLLAATAGLMRRCTGIRVITKISGFYEFEGGVLDPTRRHRPLNALLLAGLRRVDRVQTISEQTRDKLREAGIDEHRILLVPNGIDTRVTIAPSATDGVLRIGYCGRLRQIKGVHVLLEAFALLRERSPSRDVRLVIAGDGTAADELLHLAHELGVNDEIDWLGMIDQTLPFFAAIDIYVQPSFSEGLPNSVMEAMLSGRPVVATDIGGNRDLAGEGRGLLVPSGDAQALASALDSLLNDPAERARLGAAGRDEIDDHYAMDAVVDRLADAYRG